MCAKKAEEAITPAVMPAVVSFKKDSKVVFAPQNGGVRRNGVVVGNDPGGSAKLVVRLIEETIDDVLYPAEEIKVNTCYLEAAK